MKSWPQEPEKKPRGAFGSTFIPLVHGEARCCTFSPSSSEVLLLSFCLHAWDDLRGVCLQAGNVFSWWSKQSQSGWGEKGEMRRDCGEALGEELSWAEISQKGKVDWVEVRGERHRGWGQWKGVCKAVGRRYAAGFWGLFGSPKSIPVTILAAVTSSTSTVRPAQHQQQAQSQAPASILFGALIIWGCFILLSFFIFQGLRETLSGKWAYLKSAFNYPVPDCAAQVPCAGYSAIRSARVR